MANRRKFIAGLGALATGSAAAMGTGAFTSVEANRTVDINAAGDSSAYLALSSVSSSENSEYVKSDGDGVRFDFGTGNTGESNDLGDGFNVDATTKVNDLLKVTNQGTQDVEFWIEVPNYSGVNNFITVKASNNKTSSSSFSSTGSASGALLAGTSGSSATKVTLSPGDSIYLHLKVDTVGNNNALGEFTDQTITFHADATSGS